MKKLLLSLFMVVAAVATSFATETVFDLSKPELFGYETPGSNGTNLADGALKAGNVIITSKKVASNDNRFWAAKNGIELRAYKSSTLTFSTTNGEVITNIEFAGAAISATILTFDSGTYESPSWTGSASEVILTLGGTANISSITVTTVSATGVQVPRFSLAEGTYYTTQEVALSCGTADAVIYYTTDNTDPTASSTVYADPIKVETTTTIKAIAIKGGDKSDIVSAVYTISEPIAVANIGEFAGQSKDAVIKFTNSVNVIYQNGLYLFVQDATGAMQVYGNIGQVYKNGDVIPAGFMGTVGEYGGLKQLAPMADTFVAGTSGAAITPDIIATDGVVEALVNKLVKVGGVTITLDDGKTKNYTITDAKGTAAVYDRFTGVVIPKDDKKYDVTAIVNIYNGTVQLFPTEITESQNVGITGTESDNAIATVFAGDKAIKIDAAESAQVFVVNTVGQVVASKTIAAGANTVEVPAGLYLVKVNNAVTKVIIK